MPDRAEQIAEYQRRYRKANPEYAERSRVYTRCRARALSRLAERYETAYIELLADELAAEGFEWSGKGGLGVPKIRWNIGPRTAGTT